MRENLKIVIVPILLAVALVASVLFQAGSAQAPEAQVQDTQRLRTVSVFGVGQAGGQPDQALVRLGVRTDAQTATEALTQNSNQMQALIDALQNAGIAQADIQTQTINLFPRYDQQPAQQTDTPDLAGYSAINIVQVRIRNLDDLGQILDLAVQAGGNTIDHIQFEVSDAAELLRQAREAAIDDAQDKAQQLAALVNAELGMVLSIQEITRTPIPFGRGGLEAAVDQIAVPIEPGLEMIQVEVQVTWILGDGQVLPDTGQPTPTASAPASPTPTSPTPVAPTPAGPTPVGPTPVGPTPISPTPAAQASQVSTYQEFLDILRSTDDLTIRRMGEIRQPFFPALGQHLRVNGEDVLLFEFANEADRRAASDTIVQSSAILSGLTANLGSQPEIWSEGRLIVLYFGQNQAIHTRFDIILGPPITDPDRTGEVTPEVVLQAQRALSQALGVALERIEIQRFERVDWPDACLGLAAPGEACAQVITPGWRVLLTVDGQQHEYRTDLTGSTIRGGPNTNR